MKKQKTKELLLEKISLEINLCFLTESIELFDKYKSQGFSSCEQELRLSLKARNFNTTIFVKKNLELV